MVGDGDDNTAYLFESARQHVADWPAKLWHSGIGEPQSSQALCVSVWGTIAAHPGRTAVLGAVLGGAGLQPLALTGPSVICEAGARGELAYLLNETGGNATPSCIDALVDWPHGTIAIESKFTEPSFGQCGQVDPRVDKPPGAPGQRFDLGPACSGHYGPGSDLKTGTRTPCRLATWDGSRAPRLYWDLAWELFKPDVLVPDGRVCPFRGPSFQLMRNLALARAKAAPRSRRRERASPPEVVHPYWALLVVHVASHRYAERHRREFDDFQCLLREEVRDRVALTSYEAMLPVLRSQGLDDLAQHVEDRISSAT